MRAILAVMRIVFMGSPEFALPTLRRLIASQYQVIAVYTQPDRPVGRGRKPSPPPVKALAQAHRLPVHQPKSVSRTESVEELRRLAPDLIVIAAFGQILKQPVLDVPRLGALNVHASLLPRWRGAAPIPAAILAGEEHTGVTIMQVRRELDAGPMLDRVSAPIGPEDTTGTLTQRLAEVGADLLMEVLPGWAAGSIESRAQDASQATYAPPVKKTDALIDWEQEDATTAWRKVRAYNPWPMAYSHVDREPLRILAAIPIADIGAGTSEAPGTILAPRIESTDAALREVGFVVRCAQGWLGVRRVQGAGGRPMGARDYLNGHRYIVGKIMRREPEPASLRGRQDGELEGGG